ncbi:hypothetical protein O3P69_011481 [Scylla paramamosain]|uniref:Uncharacterized protein n=1 Tax=Scylla paramamosain TaxID=85552 RepID=A0AAW0T6D9_SCYPA
MEEPMMVDQVDEGGSKARGGVCVLQTKTHPIVEDYTISSNVLGLGINGKVVECFNEGRQEVRPQGVERQPQIKKRG